MVEKMYGYKMKLKIIGMFDEYIKLIWGALIYGIGIGIFLDKNNLVPGGVSGIAILVSKVTEFKTGTMILLINIPLLILGAMKLGVKFAIRTMGVVALSSIEMNILSKYNIPDTDRIIAAIIGGGLMAYGMGTILKNGGSTGGMDILIQLIRLKYKQIKTSRIVLIADIIVVAGSFMVFRDMEILLYSIFTGIICEKVMDVTIYGSDEEKVMFIILSSKDKEKILTEKILNELNVGVTKIKSIGGFENEEKEILMCGFKKNLLYKSKELVKSVDKRAFVIIANATEIIGEGHKAYEEINL